MAEGKVIFLEDAEELLKGLWGVPVKLDRVWIERNQVWRLRVPGCRG